MRVLKRLRVPSHDVDADMLTVRHIFYGHVRTANSPQLAIDAADGGFVVSLDVRAYDNYAAEAAIAEVKQRFPGTVEERADQP
jgi:hypothetical protein